MTLDPHDCLLSGSALSEPFLRLELSHVLARLGLLSTARQALETQWLSLRHRLRGLGRSGGPSRVHHHVIAPMANILGYGTPVRQSPVVTREGMEDGGWLMRSGGGTGLRAWSVAVGAGVDSPTKTGGAYRHSPTRSAARVLLASGEGAGLLTDGGIMRLLLCDPARPDSHLTVPLSGADGWQNQETCPDSYRLLSALATPRGLAALPEILDAARLHQTCITRELRVQAREGLEGFVRSVLEHPDNIRSLQHSPAVAGTLWQDGLVLVHRLLFILKLEGSSDPARAFSFASATLWRAAFSPNQALGPLVRRHLDQGHDTGRMLEEGLRAVFRAFRDGLSCGELSIAPLGGALFGRQTTHRLDRLAWGERAVALLLDRLLWTTPKGRPRERVHYGALDVEELGGVYETLLELEPGIAVEPMARLQRARREIVVPAHTAAACLGRVEDIPSGRFFLHAGGARKASGSYYTPHAFVHFLVREALGPLVRQLSPDNDPDPGAILSLRVVDPAVGSGHFLVEACRYLGEALYSACRACDEQAHAGETANEAGDEVLSTRTRIMRDRLAALPDPDGMLLAYLPSRCPASGSGLSEWRALAICRRLVAVHCLYGVDRNRLAVELAKLALWLESHAEGLPLTFLDHRLLHADSLAGPFFAQLSTLPVGGGPLDPLLMSGVTIRLATMRDAALLEVRNLEASIGRNVADLVLKEAAKQRLDTAREPLLRLARAWSGAAMLGERDANDEYLALARGIADTGRWPDPPTVRQDALQEAGALALPWDLAFPEVFGRGGFDAVLGNPPWDVVQHSTKDFVAGFDLTVLDAATKRERMAIVERVLSDPSIAAAFTRYRDGFARQKRIAARLYQHQRVGVEDASTAGNLDLFRLFAERSMDLTAPTGTIGMLLPSAFHANEGTTGIRRLYMDNGLDTCLSFENRRKLFDIDSRFKFALILVRRPGPAPALRCAFYLDRIEQIHDPSRIVVYDQAFIIASGGEHATLLELRGQDELAIARRLFAGPMTLGSWCRSHGLRLGRDLHMTDDAARFVRMSDTATNADTDTDTDVFVLHEGKTFHQFTDRWDTAPRYRVPADALAAKPAVRDAAGHFRFAFRDIARSSDERTAIATIVPPNVVLGHTATVERTPHRRSNAHALVLCALFNSYPFDWLVRQKAATHLSLYILDGLPLPTLDKAAQAFLAHGALRLCCNHAGYAPLWHDQVGNLRREPVVMPTWPVIADETDRCGLRAAMDAIIAHGYGLDRIDYARVLASFSHKSFRPMPLLCLDRFDEYAAVTGTQFHARHDPYAEVPNAGPILGNVSQHAGRTSNFRRRKSR